jgi:hypothetical protein
MVSPTQPDEAVFTTGDVGVGIGRQVAENINLQSVE